MGVTTTIALAVWLASSLIEYKIVSRVPALERYFSGLTGIAISIAIGAVVGFTMGINPQNAGFILGQFLGVATNSFTFQMYYSLEHKWMPRFRKGRDNIRKVTSAVSEFKGEHPKLYNHATESIKGGVKLIGAVIVTCLYILGLPSRAYHGTKQAHQWVLAHVNKENKTS